MNKKKEINWVPGPIAGPGVTRDGAVGKDGVIILSGDQGIIYRSTDGGKTWKTIDSGLGPWFHLFGTATDGKGRFVTAGRGRVILVSSDNGLTWAQIRPKSSERSIFKVDFGKNNLVIAADEETGYHASRDGGLTWTYNPDKKLPALRTIEFLADRFYAGSPTRVWCSVDGAAWGPLDTKTNGARAFACNEKTGTIFAGGHVICRSTDGGNTWEPVFDLKPVYGDKANIMGITCFDDFVICTGGDMLTLISRDNGKTWGQLGQYPAKGGFLGLLQTAERIYGIGTFGKESVPVCYLEKTAIGDAVLTPPVPAPSPVPPPVPTEPFNIFLANELEIIAGSLKRIIDYLRAQ